MGKLPLDIYAVCVCVSFFRDPPLPSQIVFLFLVSKYLNNRGTHIVRLLVPKVSFPTVKGVRHRHTSFGFPGAGSGK